MLYTYTKDKNFQATINSRKRLRQVSGFLSVAFLTVGLFFVAQVIYPLVNWYIFLLPNYSGSVVSPLASDTQAPKNISLAPPVRAQDESFIPPLASNNNSYRVSSWFPQAKPFTGINAKGLGVYSISIPKLKIEAATVEVGGDDLKKSLIAWPTSALPGDYGVNIIFGHSELPQFANPKDYSGIFTFIMDLSEGDAIFVDYDGIRYKYLVSDKKVVNPDDISVLEQRFDDRYLVLITCVPPGTLWQRGIVRARLSQL